MFARIFQKVILAQQIRTNHYVLRVITDHQLKYQGLSRVEYRDQLLTNIEVKRANILLIPGSKPVDLGLTAVV
ncbi:MAG: hypothetical protein QMB16_05305 [Paracoccaceae bacterium]|jgi:hypothetical protein